MANFSGAMDQYNKGVGQSHNRLTLRDQQKRTQMFKDESDQQLEVARYNHKLRVNEKNRADAEILFIRADEALRTGDTIKARDLAKQGQHGPGVVIIHPAIALTKTLFPRH